MDINDEYQYVLFRSASWIFEVLLGVSFVAGYFLSRVALRGVLATVAALVICALGIVGGWIYCHHYFVFGIRIMADLLAIFSLAISAHLLNLLTKRRQKGQK